MKYFFSLESKRLQRGVVWKRVFMKQIEMK